MSELAPNDMASLLLKTAQPLSRLKSSQLYMLCQTGRGTHTVPAVRFSTSVRGGGMSCERLWLSHCNARKTVCIQIMKVHKLGMTRAGVSRVCKVQISRLPALQSSQKRHLRRTLYCYDIGLLPSDRCTQDKAVRCTAYSVHYYIERSLHASPSKKS